MTATDNWYRYTSVMSDTDLCILRSIAATHDNGCSVLGVRGDVQNDNDR